MSVFDDIKLPKVILDTSSPYSGKIQVFQSGNTLKLLVNHTVQSINWDSPSCRRMVFGQLVEVIKDKQPDAKNILVLGMAGGTMQHLISKDLPEAQVVSVEIDPVMVDVAKKYFQVDQIPNHRILIEDACRVIVEPEKHGLMYGNFDVAVVDIYVGDKYPDLGKSGNFLAALKKMLRPGGLVIFNRIYLEHHQDDVNYFIDCIEDFFSEIESITVAGKTNSDNIIIFGRA